MENSMKQANEKNQEWKDARDVHKAFANFINRHMPDGIKIHKPNMYKEEELIAFAKFYVQRFGVEFGEYKYPIYEKGMMVKWQGSDFWVVEDNGDYNVLIANTPDFNDPEYNDWWVDKGYINKKQ